MDVATAKKNLKILNSLKPHKKLVVTDGNILVVDNRWMKGIRNVVTGNSKNKLITPIYLTYTTLLEHNTIRIEKLEKSLDKLQSTLQTTYPKFVRLWDVIEDIKRMVNIKKLDSINADVRVISFDADSEESDDSESMQVIVCCGCDSFFQNLSKKLKKTFEKFPDDSHNQNDNSKCNTKGIKHV